MSLLSAEEVLFYLSLSKPGGGPSGSSEYAELQKWHYAQLVEGIELMRSGRYQATDEERAKYVDDNTATLRMIEDDLLKYGLDRSQG
ncbi:hypothetical protein D3C87_1404120 [compost metagenome]